jgi:hypothetical protein
MRLYYWRLLISSLVVRESVGHNHPGTKAFAVVSVITIAAAFFLGIAGMVGSFRRFSVWSIVLGLFGTLLNGIILVRAASLSTPDRNRTCNLRIRSPLLYPIELRALVSSPLPAVVLPPHTP